jgi:hypothetical protein
MTDKPFHHDDIGDDPIRIEDVVVGDTIYLSSKTGVEEKASIVKVTCPACGESFMGTIRAAGGFVSGHNIYHEFINSQDLLIHAMGGI